MNQLKKISVAVITACTFGQQLTYAQAINYNPSWYVEPNLLAIDPDSGFGTNNHGEGAGLGFGKPISESWDIQLGTKYARSRDDGVHYQQNLLGVDALYMFSRKDIRPFVLVGAGYQEDRLSSASGKTSGYAPYANAGLGVQISFNDQWSMQADFRRVHGYLRDTDFPIDRSSNNYLSVGLVYSFDKPAAPAISSARTPEPTPVVAEQAPAVPQAPATPAPRFEKITLSSTELFEFNKYELRMPQPKLDEIARTLNEHQDINSVTITGYTDRIGSDRYNQKLSEQRAGAVKDYLVRQGVAADRLGARGKGKADPVVTCKETKRAALIKCLEPNRRVEVEQITVERRVN